MLRKVKGELAPIVPSKSYQIIELVHTCLFYDYYFFILAVTNEFMVGLYRSLSQVLRRLQIFQ
jgi:hypothetical protein